LTSALIAARSEAQRFALSNLDSHSRARGPTFPSVQIVQRIVAKEIKVFFLHHDR
jgi:hypothetical protein